MGSLDTAGVLDAGGADALDGTGGLRRAALFAMFLRELAHQLLEAIDRSVGGTGIGPGDPPGPAARKAAGLRQCTLKSGRPGA